MKIIRNNIFLAWLYITLHSIGSEVYAGSGVDGGELEHTPSTSRLRAFVPARSCFWCTSVKWLGKNTKCSERLNSDTPSKFSLSLRKSGRKMLSMIRHMSKNESILQIAVFKCYKLFKGGQECVEDDPRAGWPSTWRTDDNVERVRKVLNSDIEVLRRVTS